MESIIMDENGQLNEKQRSSFLDQDFAQSLGGETKIIQRIKRVSNLLMTQNSDWNEQTNLTITEWCECSQHIALLVFYVDNVLTATLSAPSLSPSQLIYFLRQPNTQITLENFNETVTFGNVTANIDEILFALMENVYMPAFLGAVEPIGDGKYTDLCLVAQRFLSFLTALQSKSLGTPILYVPSKQVGFDMLAGAQLEPQIVKIMENLAMNWIHLIRANLKIIKPINVSQTHQLIDEYDFYVERYDRLRAIQLQIASEQISIVLERLFTQNAYLVNQMHQLMVEVQQQAEKVKDIFSHLSLLVQPCGEFDEAAHLTAYPVHLLKIMQLFKFIYAHSTHLNKPDELIDLFRMLNNQFMANCQRLVDVNAFINGHSPDGIQLAQASIDCCIYYKELFLQLFHNTFGDLSVIATRIFGQIDEFLKRLQDLIEMCDFLRIYTRLEFSESIAAIASVQPNVPATDLFVYFNWKNQTIWKQSSVIHDQFKRHSANMLDIHNLKWNAIFFELKDSMHLIDQMVFDLIENVFARDVNVEEGIGTLQMLFNYSMRASIKPLYTKQVEHVWQLYANDLIETSIKLQRESNMHLSAIPKYSYNSLLLQINLHRIERFEKLFEMAEWLPDTAVAGKVQKQCELLKCSIERNLRQLFDDWKAEVTKENLKAITKRTLMRKFGGHNEYIQCNIDNYIFSICHEAYYFERMQCKLPPSIKQIYAKHNVIKLVHTKVTRIVLHYNKIQKSLSSNDRALFQPLLTEVDRKIMPGILRVTWDDDFIEQFIVECVKKMDQIYAGIKLYKMTNSYFQRCCEKIARFVICQIDVRQSSDRGMVGITCALNTNRGMAERYLREVYDDIIKIVLIILSELQKNIDKIRVAWCFYISKLDWILEESFKLAIQKTHGRMFDALHGKNLEPAALFEIEATLHDRTVSIAPSLDAIDDFLHNASQICIKVIASFSRITRKFRYSDVDPPIPYDKSIEFNAAYRDGVAKITMEMNTVRRLHAQWLAKWCQILHLLDETDDHLTRELAAADPRSAIVNQLLDEFDLLAKKVRTGPTLTKVHFVTINASRVKSAIVKDIQLRKSCALSALNEISIRTITDLYEYIAENTRALLTEPTNHDEIEASILLQQKLTQEAKSMEIKFPEFSQYFRILENHLIEIPADVRTMLDELDTRWKRYLDQFQQAANMLEDSRAKVKQYLLGEKVQLDAEIGRLKDWFAGLPTASVIPVDTALRQIDETREKLRSLCRREEELLTKMKQIKCKAHANADLPSFDVELKILEDVWLLAKRWQQTSSQYKLNGIAVADTNEMENEVDDLTSLIKAIVKRKNDCNWEVLAAVRKSLTEFNRTLPLLKALRNAALKERHWTQMKDAVNQVFDETSDAFTLGTIIDMNFQAYFDKIMDISQAATMELQIEKNLRIIDGAWNDMRTEFIPLGDDLYRIYNVDDCFAILDDNLMQVLTMKGTRFGEPFMEQIDFWEKTLNNIQETLELALNVQKMWLYLRNIFQGDDIRKQLPKENALLIECTDKWKHLIGLMRKGKNIIKSTDCARPRHLLDKFGKLHGTLENIQRALEIYLERKRQNFPRFYFISDDDLLDVLGNAAKPHLVEKHLHKVFDSIHSCEIKLKRELHGMYADDGEYVKFLAAVIVSGPAEHWLRELEMAMRRVLRERILLCTKSLLDNNSPAKIAPWLQQWPAQLCLTAAKIQWTLNCTKTLQLCNYLDSNKPFRRLYKRQCAILAVLADLSRQPMHKQMRLKVHSTITIQIHGRDVIQKLYRFNCQSVSHFEWFSQLRFYWDKEHSDCAIKQTNTTNWYNYEYIGNSGRLIITPLTDRCYITLTTALHMYLGGSPKGPAGTGKSTKIFSKTVSGMYLLQIPDI